MYKIDIYQNNKDNSARFTLGCSGKHPLFVLGLNPSTADDQKPDRTITKIITFAKNAHFDGFVMLNLYAQRTPYPNQLHVALNQDLHLANLEKIRECLGSFKQPSILAAWGGDLRLRPYLFECLQDIWKTAASVDPNWLKIGELTQNGHPRHPSRAAYKFGLTTFNIHNYLEERNIKVG